MQQAHLKIERFQIPFECTNKNSASNCVQHNDRLFSKLKSPKLSMYNTPRIGSLYSRRFSQESLDFTEKKKSNKHQKIKQFFDVKSSILIGNKSQNNTNPLILRQQDLGSNNIEDDIEVISTEDHENCYDTSEVLNNRIKSRFEFNSEIDKSKRMEKITLEISKVI